MTFHQLVVVSFVLHEYLMIPYLHYLPLIHHHYLVSMAYGAEPVGYDDHRPVFKCSAERLDYLLLIDSVKRVGGFIKKEILLYLVIMSLYPMGIATLIYITYYF